jgi:Uma2 family endonuclease
MEAVAYTPSDDMRAGVVSATLQRLEAWLSLPDGDRAELLDGRIVYKSMPSFEHGDAVIGISGQLDRLRGPPGAGGGGWWLSQEVDLYLGGQGVRPDVVGWRVDRHPAPPRKVNVGARHLGVYVTAPDWVCEVLSDSTRTRDENEGLKWRAYWDAGVGHYWLVDLTRNQLTVYRRGERDYEPVDVAGRESVKALAPFDAIEFSARRVFMLADVTAGPQTK